MKGGKEGGRLRVPYFRDQTLRLLFISSRDFPRPLFEGGH